MQIVAVTPDRDNYLTCLNPYLPQEIVFCRQFSVGAVMDLNPDIILLLADWTYELVEIIEKAKQRNIPTVLLMDGIYEWKGFLENPKWSYNNKPAPYLPVYADKVFVGGPASYRFLEFLGNHGKCEITGFPRMDVYNDFKLDTKKDVSKLTIGVLSANTAGYIPKHFEQTKEAFRDLYNYSKEHSEIEFKWRIRKGFEKHLDITFQNDPSSTLLDFFSDVNVIISQPSTVAYEAMLMGLPVALMDYGGFPNQLSAAWSISSKAHISEVIEEFKSLDPLKLLIQKQILEDTFAFVGNSCQIAASIILEMFRISQTSENKQVKYPHNMFLKYIDPIQKEYYEVNTLFPKRAVKLGEGYQLEEKHAKQADYINRLKIKIKSESPFFQALLSLKKKIFKRL